MLVCLALTCWWAGQAWAHDGLHEQIIRLAAEIALHPRDAALRFQLAETCRLHGEWPQALALLDVVDRLAPGRFQTELPRGQALVAAGRMKEALEPLERFLAAHPDDPAALLCRARALSELGPDDACLASYQRALEKTPQPEPDLYWEVAEAFTKRERTEQAIAVLQQGLARLGDLPSLLMPALQLETSAGRYDDALARIEAMRKSAPRPEPWMAKRAAILAQAGRIGEARAAWQALLDHLAALPNLERGSHAMSILAEQARQAVAALPGSDRAQASLSSPNPSQP